MSKLSFSEFLVIFLIIVIVGSFLVFSFVSSAPKKTYWHYVEGYYPRLAGGYGGAPDGEYTILVAFINTTDCVVGSAYCESSPGSLHGYWHYKEGLNFTIGMYKVYLENNVIVRPVE